MKQVSKGIISDEALLHGKLLQTRRVLVSTLYRAGGEYQDRSGRATRKLISDAGITGGQTNVSAVLRNMEKEGWVERKIGGKRTYSITLIPQHKLVSKLINFFEEEVEDEPLAPARLVPIEEEVESWPPEEPVDIDPPAKIDWSADQDTSIVDASSVANELLLRVVDILNNPTDEDLHHRLAKQIDYATQMRSRVKRLEDQLETMKTHIEAKDTRIAALNREKAQLESNLRAALKQEQISSGEGVRALAKFMQERPNARA